MLGESGSKEIGTIDIDSLELSHAVNRVIGSVKVFGEAGGVDQVVDFVKQ